MTKRHFSPDELNHLNRYGMSKIDLDSLGEMPVEYVTGHAQFLNLDFLVSPHTLIPRIESEKIVQIALDHIGTQKIDHPYIADIGTGSGCLGISLAYKLSKSQTPYSLFLSDISQPALTIARENVDRLLPSPVNIFFEQSDLFQAFPKIKFDLILANLPYIPSENIPSLDSSVRDFEPSTALDGGPKGTEIISRLLKELPFFLSEIGLAILEIDDTHRLAYFSPPKELTIKTEADIFNRQRFLVISRK